MTGLEPATSGVTGQRSNQLSYTPVMPCCEGLDLSSAERKVNNAGRRAAAGRFPDPIAGPLTHF